MKQLDKTIVMAAFSVIGIMGVNTKVNAQVYEPERAGAIIISEPQRGVVYEDVYESGPISEKTYTTSNALGYKAPTQKVASMDAAAPKTRQQVVDELIEARKNGLMDLPE